MQNEKFQEKITAANAAACCAQMPAMQSFAEHVAYAHHSDARDVWNAFMAFAAEQDLHTLKFLPQEFDVEVEGITHVSHALYASLLSFFVVQTHGALLRQATSTFEYAGATIRVTWAPSLYGTTMILALHDTSPGKELHDVGMKAHHIALLDEYLRRPGVGVVVIGPRGAAKTEVATALLRLVNTDRSHVISLEEYPEIFVPGVNYLRGDDVGMLLQLQRLPSYDVDVAMLPEMLPHRVDDAFLHGVSALLRMGTRVVMGVTVSSLDDALAVFAALPRDLAEIFFTSGTVVFVALSPQPRRRTAPSKILFEILPLDEGLRHLFLSDASFGDILSTARANGLS